jgi:hypothetical protein
MEENTPCEDEEEDVSSYWRVLEIEGASTRTRFVENLLRKTLWTCLS